MMVVDANMLIELVLDQGNQAAVFRVIQADTSVVLPPLWRYEVAHVLWRIHRAGGMDSAALATAVGTLNEKFEGRELPVDLLEVVATARRYGLSSAYDASYVALAERLGCGLLTMDQELLRKVPWACRSSRTAS